MMNEQDAMVDDQSLWDECHAKTVKFLSQCEELRKHMYQLMGQQEKKKFDSKLLNNGSSILLDIKESHRDISATQEQLHKLRDSQTHKSDALRLQLQNLQYEAYHLRKKIAHCKQFASRHTQIDMIPLEEFMQVAPTELRTIDSFGPTEERDHKLMINRLQYELKTRQNLLTQLNELTNKKSSLQALNQQKQNFLLDLRENLKEYEKINKKLAEYMKVDVKKTEDFDVARVLPTPLYILYNNLLSYQLHFDQTIKLSFEGDIKEGREALMSMIANKIDSQVFANEEEEEEEENDRNENINVDSDSMQDEEQVIEERPMKKAKTMINATIKDERFNLFPISIILEIPVALKDGTRLVTMKFSYLINYKMIVVSETVAKNETVILPTLVPNDDGTRSPSAQYLTYFDFTLFEAGRPYKWAQWPAGLDHLESPSTRDPSSPAYRMTVSTIIKLIRYKVRAEKALNAQIRDLEKLKLTDINRSLFDKRFEMTDFKLEKTDKNQKTYVALFTGDENRVKVRCHIKIAYRDYPLQLPIFELKMEAGDMGIRNFEIPESMKNLVLDERAMFVRDRSESVDLAIRDIERELNETFVLDLIENDRYSEKNENNDKHFSLLSKLMAHLWTCLNVYGSVEGGGKRIATREHRGRARQIPTRFDALLNLFDQVQM